MSKTEQKIDAFEHNEKRKKQIFAAVIVILVLTFLVGMVWGGYNIMNTEGAHPPYVQSLSKEPLSKNDAIKTFDYLLKKCQNPAAVRVDITNWLNVPESDDYPITVKPDVSSLDVVLRLIKSNVADTIKNKYYSEYSSEFDTDFTDKLLPIDFTSDNIISYECKQNENDGNFLLLNMVFAPIPLPQNTNDVIYTSFGLQNTKDIAAKIGSEYSDVFSVKSYDIQCSKFEITAEYNRFSDNLKNVKYMRRYTVSADLLFCNKYAELGEHTVTFTFEAETTYSFEHAGIVLNLSALTIEKNKTEALQATLTPFDTFGVKWTSSNPDVAKVDNEGYVKGVSVSSEPVYIKVEGDFNSNHYEAVCVVYVVTPVEEVHVTPKTLQLHINEKNTLSVKLTPHNATIKTVTWYTENEDIAVVEQDGTVTAVGEGTVKVYALSDDGYIRSSCVITVTK